MFGIAATSSERTHVAKVAELELRASAKKLEQASSPAVSGLGIFLPSQVNWRMG